MALCHDQRRYSIRFGRAAMNSSWVCVDASLVVSLVVDPAAELIQHLWGHLSTSSVQLAFRAALALPLELHGVPDLHWRALDLAEKFCLPAAYDAHYLALAELLAGEFWTANRRLARTVQSSLPWVHLVE
jgi:predicted nucleic acid-binding protein